MQALPRHSDHQPDPRLEICGVCSSQFYPERQDGLLHCGCNLYEIDGDSHYDPDTFVVKASQRKGSSGGSRFDARDLRISVPSFLAKRTLTVQALLRITKFFSLRIKVALSQ